MKTKTKTATAKRPSGYASRRIARRKRKVRWESGVPYVIINGKRTYVRALLGDGDSNAKLRKSNRKSRTIETCGLSLAPHISSGWNTCRFSGHCAETCLDETGCGAMFESVHRQRIAKTTLLFRERQYFVDMLCAELAKAKREANDIGKALAFRPNVFSDIPWERVAPDVLTIADHNYDYSKYPDRFGELAPNYWVTYSRDSADTDSVCLDVLRAGGNVAMAFCLGNHPKSKIQAPLPETWRGFPVISGDETDMRFDDPRGGYVVGLTFKFFDYARRDIGLASGFAIDCRTTEVN